jgi:hypothetical protein
MNGGPECASLTRVWYPFTSSPLSARFLLVHTVTAILKCVILLRISLVFTPTDKKNYLIQEASCFFHALYKAGMMLHMSQYYHYSKGNAKEQGADEERVMLFISAINSLLSRVLK